MGDASPEHTELPQWMQLAPLAGAVALAVPVAAQRGFRWDAVVLVGAIAVVAVLDARHMIPLFVCTAGLLACTFLLLQSSDRNDVAPFYLVAITAASAASRPPRRSVPVTLVAIGLLVVAWWGYDDTVSGMVIWTLGIGLAHLGGAGVRAQAELTAELRLAQEDLATRAAEDERQRIAREVHDVIAHSLTVTMLHLTGARLSLESGDSGEAAAALREAERLGLQSLGDIRRVVGVLGAPGATTAPQPSATNIPALVDEYRAAGLDVHVDIDGDLASVSPATGLGLYRIAQEALANVGRHASGAAARVVIRVGRDDVVLAVTNPVPATTPAGRGTDGGLGIAGMRTRADALGGTCAAGLGAQGGWEVHVSIPRDAA